ncbi:MAG: hypothetical protein ACMXYF_05270 [Candidatus Woesearchaeota archaeon]
MELPINVMIVLVIGVIVAAVVVIFVQNTLDDTRDQLDYTFADGREEANKVLRVSSLTDSKLVALLEECHQRYFDSLTDELCYVVIGNVSNLQNVTIANSLDSLAGDFDLSEVDGLENVLVIEYNVQAGKMQVKEG